MPDTQHHKLLLVEDEPDLIAMYQLAFSSHTEIDLRVVSDVESGVQTARDFVPDLILLDIIIPMYKGGILEFEKREGFHLLEMIRQNPRLKNTKFIVTTNLDTLADRERSKQLQALEYVVKADLTPNQIVEKALAALRQK